MLDIRTEGRHPTGMDGFLNFVTQQALKEAFSAGENGEIPVAAAVFIPEEKKIIAMASNRTEQDNDPTAHAEILAVREACRILKAPRLPKCDIYVTLEPCPMCATAIAFARIRRLYFGAYDVKGGAVEHGCRMFESQTNLKMPEIYGGIKENDAALLLKNFFQNLRTAEK